MPTHVKMKDDTAKECMNNSESDKAKHQSYKGHAIEHRCNEAPLVWCCKETAKIAKRNKGAAVVLIYRSGIWYYGEQAEALSAQHGCSSPTRSAECANAAVSESGPCPLDATRLEIRSKKPGCIEAMEPIILPV